MKLFILENKDAVEAKNLNRFIDYWNDWYYHYTWVSDEIYEFALENIQNKKNISETLSLIGAWKTNSLSKNKNYSDYRFAYRTNDGKITYYFNRMWKENTSSAYEIWPTLKAPIESIDGLDEKTIEAITNKTYVGPKQKPRRFGLVYTITFMHFIRPTKYPILDKFVKISLRYLSSNNHEIVFKKMLNINNYYDYKNKYIPKYNEIAADYSGEPRKVDRALWSFGHWISTNKEKKVYVKKNRLF